MDKGRADAEHCGMPCMKVLRPVETFQRARARASA